MSYPLAGMNENRASEDSSAVHEYYTACGEVIRLPEHDDVFLPSLAGVFFWETIFYKRLCNLSREAQILDLGCGSGFIAIALAKHGFNNIVASDINAHHVAYAETQYRQNNQDCSGADFIQSDLLDGINLERRFDVIAFNCPGWATPTAEYKEVLQRISKSQYFSMFEGDRIASKCITTAIDRLNPGGSLFLGLNSIGDIKSVLSATTLRQKLDLQVVPLGKIEFPLLLYNEIWKAHSDLLLAQIDIWRGDGTSYVREEDGRLVWSYEVIEIRLREEV